MQAHCWSPDCWEPTRQPLTSRPRRRQEFAASFTTTYPNPGTFTVVIPAGYKEIAFDMSVVVGRGGGEGIGLLPSAGVGGPGYGKGGGGGRGSAAAGGGGGGGSAILLAGPAPQ